MEIITKAERREKKKKNNAKMKVSGAGVKDLQHLIADKFYSK